jgi:hypothetical protein
METLNIFLCLAVVALAMISVSWSSSDFLNKLIKLFLSGLTLWALFLLLANNGYIMKRQTAPNVTKEAPAPKAFERNQPGPYTK